MSPANLPRLSRPASWSCSCCYYLSGEEVADHDPWLHHSVKRKKFHHESHAVVLITWKRTNLNRKKSVSSQRMKMIFLGLSDYICPDGWTSVSSSLPGFCILKGDGADGGGGGSGGGPRPWSEARDACYRYGAQLLVLDDRYFATTPAGFDANAIQSAKRLIRQFVVDASKSSNGRHPMYFEFVARLYTLTCL